MPAVLAAAERDPFRVHIRRTRCRDRQGERMVAEAFSGLGEHRGRNASLDRFVGIIVAARALERIAARHDPSAQIAGLPRDAAQLVEAVVA